MNMRWRKVLGDLRQYGGQIGLISLVLAIGIAGVVATLSARTVLKREIAVSVGRAQMPDLALMYERVTPELLSAVASESGVVKVDARRVVYTRVRAKDGVWLPMRLTVLRDFSAQQLGVVHLDQGAWPPAEGAIFIEQSGQELIDAGVGGSLAMRTPTADIVTLPVAAFVHDTAVAPSTQERIIYAFVTPATAALMGQGATLDQLLVKMASRASYAEASEFSRVLNANLTRKAIQPYRVDTLFISHPHAALMNAVVQVLGVVAAMAILCSSALAAYMVAAMMRREVVQVGIMKTMGAQTMQIAAQYLAWLIPMSLIALILGIAGGWYLSGLLVESNALSFNIDVASAQVAPSLWAIEIVAALGVPLFAMALPIMRAARMSPRAAIHDAGVVPPSARAARVALWLLKFPGSVGLTFALRNTWRRPWRLTAMVLALTFGGALLLFTRTNYQSMMSVIDASLKNQGYDIEVLMPGWTSTGELEAIAKRVPEVEIVEAWRRANIGVGVGVNIGAGGGESDAPSRFTLIGYPADSRLFKPTIVEGRAAQTANEVVMTRTLRDRDPSMQIGRTIELPFRERRTKVQIVGMAEQIASPIMYANSAAFESITGLGVQANALRIKARNNDIDSVVSAVDQAFLEARLPPGQIISRAMARDSLEEHFKVVGDVVRMVAFTMALVGSIILAATTGLNVLERSREIGIIRTIGATPRRIAAIFMCEAASVLLVSGALAIALSLVLSRWMLDITERSLLNVTVPLQFSTMGLAQLALGGLLVMVVVTVTLAFRLRKSVRESVGIA
jgi:putative ABC transport system permease protein